MRHWKKHRLIWSAIQRQRDAETHDLPQGTGRLKEGSIALNSAESLLFSIS